MLNRSIVVGTFYFPIQKDKNTVDMSLRLFYKYLESLGFKQRSDYSFQEKDVYIKIKQIEREKEDTKDSLIAFVSIKNFNLKCRVCLDLVDFSELDVLNGALMFIPKIRWTNQTKLTQEDLLFPDEIGKLLSEDRLINPSIILNDCYDYEAINTLIIFSALVTNFYLSLVISLKEVYDHISQKLRSFTAIITHNKYVTLKELTQKFDRWLEKLKKLSNFLDSNFYRVTGKLIDSNCFETISRDLSDIIKNYYTKSKEELIISIEDVDKLYTGRISEKSAIVGGIIGAIIGVILTYVLKS